MKYIKIVLLLLLLTLNTAAFAEEESTVAVRSLDLDECALIVFNPKDKESITGRTYYNLHTVKTIYVQGDSKIKINGSVVVSADPSEIKDVLETYVDCTERD